MANEKSAAAPANKKRNPLRTTTDGRTLTKEEWALLRANVFRAIHTHLATVGSKHWNEIKNQFPEIKEPIFWKWIAEAKRTTPARQDLTTAKTKLKNAMTGVEVARDIEARQNGVEHIAKHIPAAPSPAYLSKNGLQGQANIDFLLEFNRLYADCEMLRAYSIKEEVIGVGQTKEAVKNPMTFDKSIARRASVLELGIRALQQIWDTRMMNTFYETIINEIRAEAPEVAERIIRRLAALNSQLGMTMNMRL
jgi:hypothetical protein